MVCLLREWRHRLSGEPVDTKVWLVSCKSWRAACPIQSSQQENLTGLSGRLYPMSVSPTSNRATPATAGLDVNIGLESRLRLSWLHQDIRAGGRVYIGADWPVCGVWRDLTHKYFLPPCTRLEQSAGRPPRRSCQPAGRDSSRRPPPLPLHPATTHTSL